MNNIAFPKLGISLNISPVAFSIGSKPIYWYALIILSGFLLGLFFVYKTCEKRGVKKDNVYRLVRTYFRNNRRKNILCAFRTR